MSVHIHTTIPQKTNKILDELAKSYGTKSRVLEQALETFLRVEKVGSCDDCAIKAKMVEQSNLRGTLDLTSIGKKTLNGLLEVAIGDKSFEDFITEQQIEARNNCYNKVLLIQSVHTKPAYNIHQCLCQPSFLS